MLSRSFLPLLAASLVALPGRTLSSQSAAITGVVQDSAGRPLAGVEVHVEGHTARTTSNSDGRFVIRNLPQGLIVLTTRYVGYAPYAVRVFLGAGQDTAVSITLARQPAVLPEIEVKGRVIKPAKYAGTTKYDDFFRRQQSKFGTFITREEIEKSNAFHTHELLRLVPGIRVTSAAADPLSVRIAFNRCTGGQANVVVFIDGERLLPTTTFETRTTTRTRESPRGGEVQEAQTTRSSLQRGQGAALAEMLSRISAPQIEMIEIYRGVSEIPGELNEDACAVVFIWTRWNPPRRATDTVPQ